MRCRLPASVAASLALISGLAACGGKEPINASCAACPSGGADASPNTSDGGADASSNTADGGAGFDGGLDPFGCPADPYSLPGSACYSCEPLPAGAPGGCTDLPQFGTAWTNPAPTSTQYPVGCVVTLPVKSGPGQIFAQRCTCAPADGPTGHFPAPWWLCPV